MWVRHASSTVVMVGAVSMHPFRVEECAKLPRRAVALLYDRTGRPFRSTAAIQERLRDLMLHPAVQEALADLVARELIAEGTSFTFTACARTPAATSWSRG